MPFLDLHACPAGFCVAFVGPGNRREVLGVFVTLAEAAVAFHAAQAVERTSYARAA